MELKVCKLCGVEKPLNGYYKCNSGLHYFEDADFITKASKYITDYPALKFPPTKY